MDFSIPSYPNKIYVASSLQNWQRVEKLWHRLSSLNIEPTYDWVPLAKAIYADGATLNKDGVAPLDKLKEIAELEYQGVCEAEHLLLVLPGERGSHFELGTAYARYRMVSESNSHIYLQNGVPIPIQFSVPITILMGNDTAPRPTSFHYLQGIKHTFSDDEAIANVQHYLKNGCHAP